MLSLKYFTSFIILMPLFVLAQIPSGAIAKYPLNTNASDISGNAYNGTVTSVTSTSNRLGTAGKALAFTAGSSTGTLPLGLVTATQSNFSMGYWFKTSMTASSSTQWYGGNAMVDAEVCGGTNDWGTALIDGGKVCFGIGNADVTIKSPLAAYNNNAWHFVTVTRNRTAGAIFLYVDGTQVATATGTNTGALTAPNLIGLARNPCVATGVYTGSLDDIIFYNRVLTATEVSNLYIATAATALPVQWISFTGNYTANNIVLKWEVENATNNDHYEVESSGDAIHFTVEGSISDGNAVSVTAGRQLYSFTSMRPPAGDRFYRVKQADKDGAYTYSTTIKIQVQQTVQELWLQTNPVAGELVLVNQRRQFIQRLLVTDISGRIISDKSINSSNSIVSSTTHGLQPGYYLLRVVMANSTQSVPMIKQ